jgi:hypothetical protein
VTYRRKTYETCRDCCCCMLIVDVENWDKSSHIVCRCRESNVTDEDCTVEEANVVTTHRTVHITYMFLGSITNVLRELDTVLYRAKHIQRIRDLEGAGLRRKDEYI